MNLSQNTPLKLINSPQSGAAISVPEWWDAKLDPSPAIRIAAVETKGPADSRMNLQLTVEAPPAEFLDIRSYTQEQIRSFSTVFQDHTVLGLRSINGHGWEGKMVVTAYRIGDKELIAIQHWTIYSGIATAVTLTGRVWTFDGMRLLHDLLLPGFIPANRLSEEPA